jgi:hypothetical protein
MMVQPNGGKEGVLSEGVIEETEIHWLLPPGSILLENEA